MICAFTNKAEPKNHKDAIKSKESIATFITFFMLLLSSISTARFIQPDSIIGDKYNPQNLNRYSYVLNNPYKYTDPTGKDAVSIEITNSVGSGNFLSGTTYGVAFVNFNPGLAGVGGSSSLLTYTRQIEGGTSAPGTTGVSVNLGYSPFATTPQDLVSGAKSGELSVPLGGFGISVPSAAQSSSDKIKGLGFSGGVGLDIMLFNFKDVTYSEAKINILWDKNKGTGNGQNNLNLN